MSLGTADRQTNLLDDMSTFCDKTFAKDSVYAFLHRETDRLFPDEAFSDLFATGWSLLRTPFVHCCRDGAPTRRGLF